MQQLYVNLYLTKNTPGLKKEWSRSKTILAEKDVKSNGQPMFPRFESFGHDELTANIVISGTQGLLMLMGSDCFDGDYQAAKHCSFMYLNVLRPGHLYQKF